MGKRTLTAVIHREEGRYSARCPEVGTISQGRNPDEALENLRQATEVYLSVFPYKQQGPPVFRTFDVNVKEAAEGEESI